MAKTLLYEDQTLLDDLNEIADIAIGNEKSEDVGIRDHNTLPEALSYLMAYPNSHTGIRDAIIHCRELVKKVNALYDKIIVIENKHKIKNKKLY